MLVPKKIFVCLLFFCCCLLLGGCSAAAETSGPLIVQGSLKMEEINLNSKLAGVIDEVLVEEGQEVAAGDILIRVDNRSLVAKKQQAEAALQAAIGQQQAAESALLAAQAQYEKAKNGARSQDIAQAEAAFLLAEKAYERATALHEAGAASDASLDQAALQYTVAQQTYNMAKEGARTEDVSMAQATAAQAAAMVEAAKGQVLVAEGAIAEVDTYLDDAEIKAPISGRVTSINIRAGELISTGMSLATITNFAKPWVEVKVRETDLPLISWQQRVEVSIAAYSEQVFQGTVVKISQKPDFATKRATSNNGTFDVLSYGVKVDLTDLAQTVYPGMTVFVNFGAPEEGAE